MLISNAHDFVSTVNYTKTLPWPRKTCQPSEIITPALAYCTRILSDKLEISSPIGKRLKIRDYYRCFRYSPKVPAGTKMTCYYV